MNSNNKGSKTRKKGDYEEIENHKHTPHIKDYRTSITSQHAKCIGKNNIADPQLRKISNRFIASVFLSEARSFLWMFMFMARKMVCLKLNIFKNWKPHTRICTSPSLAPTKQSACQSRKGKIHRVKIGFGFECDRTKIATDRPWIYICVCVCAYEIESKLYKRWKRLDFHRLNIFQLIQFS